MKKIFVQCAAYTLFTLFSKCNSKKKKVYTSPLFMKTWDVVKEVLGLEWTRSYATTRRNKCWKWSGFVYIYVMVYALCVCVYNMCVCVSVRVDV